MVAKSTDSPTVDLNLDTLEYEGDVAPFGFVLKGRRYELPCAQLIEVDTLNLLTTDPSLFFAEVMSAEDHAEFLKVRLPFHKLRTLARSYTTRYGLGN